MLGIRFLKTLKWKVINIAGVVVNYFLAPLVQERFSLLCCSIDKILRAPRLENPAKSINLNAGNLTCFQMIDVK